MKKLLILIFSISIIGNIYSQTPKSILMPGPQNFGSGIIDGVVMKEAVITKAKVPYQYVREADYVWSKRVYSRIDSREKINHNLFLPHDFISSEYNILDLMKNQDDPNWERNAERYSLWTLIRLHVINGDLPVFAPSSDETPEIEDGYSFKYEILSNMEDPFFKDVNYRNKISKLIGFTSAPKVESYSYYDSINEEKVSVTVVKTGNLEDYLNDANYAQLKFLYNQNPQKIKSWWDATLEGEEMKGDGASYWVTSKCIVGYNIKEDWFFDKQRSVLDRRIIAIAPVVKFGVDLDDDGNSTGERGDLLLYPPTDQETLHYYDGKSEILPYEGQVEDRELFWLYFPHLRNHMVQYYVYNDKSDAQWMSFDDFFWKRQFNSQIYKTSDKFDREIEDYKYGVDALYEAERIKDEIRKWEIDVWNY
ncbi:MAG: hypothetical protein NTY55_03430 [Flavobacteriia bacterium]|nr:hypothetical protein [Flavobacteriia bacterium]